MMSAPWREARGWIRAGWTSDRHRRRGHGSAVERTTRTVRREALTLITKFNIGSRQSQARLLADAQSAESADPVHSITSNVRDGSPADLRSSTTSRVSISCKRPDRRGYRDRLRPLIATALTRERPCGSSRSTSGSCGFRWSGRSGPARAARTHLDHILVRVVAGGVIGWGECASPSDPYYCPETTETCWHILKDFLAPAGAGSGLVDDRRAGRRSIGSVKGNRFARAGLEMACWDAAGPLAGQSAACAAGRHAGRDPLGGQPGDREPSRGRCST